MKQPLNASAVLLLKHPIFDFRLWYEWQSHRAPVRGTERNRELERPGWAEALRPPPSSAAPLCLSLAVNSACCGQGLRRRRGLSLQCSSRWRARAVAVAVAVPRRRNPKSEDSRPALLGAAGGPEPQVRPAGARPSEESYLRLAPRHARRGRPRQPGPFPGSREGVPLPHPLARPCILHPGGNEGVFRGAFFFKLLLKFSLSFPT